MRRRVFVLLESPSSTNGRTRTAPRAVVKAERLGTIVEEKQDDNAGASHSMPELYHAQGLVTDPSENYGRTVDIYIRRVLEGCTVAMDQTVDRVTMAFKQHHEHEIKVLWTFLHFAARGCDHIPPYIPPDHRKRFVVEATPRLKELFGAAHILGTFLREYFKTFMTIKEQNPAADSLDRTLYDLTLPAHQWVWMNMPGSVGPSGTHYWEREKRWRMSDDPPFRDLVRTWVKKTYTSPSLFARDSPLDGPPAPDFLINYATLCDFQGLRDATAALHALLVSSWTDFVANVLLHSTADFDRIGPSLNELMKDIGSMYIGLLELLALSKAAERDPFNARCVERLDAAIDIILEVLTSVNVRSDNILPVFDSEQIKRSYDGDDDRAKLVEEVGTAIRVLNREVILTRMYIKSLQSLAKLRRLALRLRAISHRTL